MPLSVVPVAEPTSGKTPRATSPRKNALWCLAALLVEVAGCCAWALAFPSQVPARVGEIVEDLTGANPNPVTLQRPAAVKLSAVAELGKNLFFDPTLSASGRQSCASCHSPGNAFGPPNQLVVQPGGPHMTLAGYRPPPSLMYLYRQPNFSIGPDAGEADVAPDLAQLASQAASTQKARKNAGAVPATPAMVPQGGLFWDGRVDTLQAQASVPMLNPVEMANTNMDDVSDKLQRTSYKGDFLKLFGPNIFRSKDLAISEAMFAIARYQVEEQSFHPYSSKYDYWLAGNARFSQAELPGLRVVYDPTKRHCACRHLHKATASAFA